MNFSKVTKRHLLLGLTLVMWCRIVKIWIDIDIDSLYTIVMMLKPSDFSIKEIDNLIHIILIFLSSLWKISWHEIMSIILPLYLSKCSIICMIFFNGRLLLFLIFLRAVREKKSFFKNCISNVTYFNLTIVRLLEVICK